MKEATGELNMTVIVVIAIAAVAALFYAFIWPAIQKSLVNNTCKTYGENYEAVSSTKVDTGNGAEVKEWKCCPDGNKSSKDCKDAN